VLQPARACILSDRRRTAPYGLSGGEDGKIGRNAILRDGVEMEIPGKACFDLLAGDVIEIHTPGGGGHGPDAP
jgi:N-methylhydantoinase B/oxoprolinase/acetone carboxylase alpha subunit